MIDVGIYILQIILLAIAGVVSLSILITFFWVAFFMIASAWYRGKYSALQNTLDVPNTEKKED